MRTLIAVFLCLGMGQAAAHQFQTLALMLEEQEADLVSVVLKSSLGRDGRPSNVAPRFEPDCEPRGMAQQERLDDLLLRSWTMHCPGGLQTRSLTLTGLGPSSPDAVVSIHFIDGSSHTSILDQRENTLALGASVMGSNSRQLTAYIPIGIKHILAGPDHLLFVLCLILVVASMQSGWQRLLLTVTAFTLAHSLTLAASTLYGLSLPAAAVEAVIALSILLLAVELARHHRWPDMSPGLSLQYPAAVAFLFGLLHGFGFAGALSQVGLPQAAAGWALLLFNLGVEAGQLIFVLGICGLLWLVRQVADRPVSAYVPLLTTVMGSVSAYWFIDRLLPVFVI